MLDQKETVTTEERNHSVPAIVNAVRYFYFSIYFSIGCITSFQTVLYHKAGINGSQIGTITSVGLIGAIISPVCIGFIVDKTKKSKLILAITVSLALLFNNLPIVCLALFIFKSKAHDSPILTSISTNASMDMKLPHNVQLLVVLLSISQFIGNFCDFGSKSLADGVSHRVVDMGRKRSIKVDWSRIRMFGGMGIAFSTLITGFVLDYIKLILPSSIPSELAVVLFSIVFGTTCVITVLLYIPNVQNKTDVDLKKAVIAVLQRPTFMIILMTQFFIQFGSMVTKSFDNLFLLKIGGNKALCGVAGFIQSICDSLFMFFSTTIIAAVGSKELAVILISCFGACRAFIYSYNDNPWLAINNSIIIGFIVGVQVPALSVLIKTLAPVELISSFVSLLITVGKIGASAGSKTGGTISHNFGYPIIYRMSSLSFILAILTLLLAIYCTKRSKKNEEKKEKPEIV